MAHFGRMQDVPGKRSREGWRFDNSYARLPEALYSRVVPHAVPRPSLVVLNRDLAILLGLDPEVLWRDGAEVFSGNTPPPGAEPIAQAYAGHQFGGFTNLGDGRAILLGEQMTPRGARYDVQLKGSGRTPYSRGGDGRAALGPMLREYIISEAMHALGIPTTRSLAVVATGERVMREEALPGAVLTRVAASHIRVGTLEYAAAIGDDKVLQALMDYTLRRHDPELVEAENPALALLGAVLERQAALVARWMCVGFIHGVMNTDNMALSGETIDYGPCAFMDVHDPATVFSSIDRAGRYAYGNQPRIAHWNLARLAESLLPLINDDVDKAVAAAGDVLAEFPARFHAHYLAGLRAKLGLITEEEGDFELAGEFLDWMKDSKADFTMSFSALTAETRDGITPTLGGDSLAAWHAKRTARLQRQQKGGEEVAEVMRRANPVVIPRNHRVEEALSAATAGDLSAMNRLMDALSHPFEETEANKPYRETPIPGSEPYRTFCGT